jgi:hypothetical protein
MHAFDWDVTCSTRVCQSMRSLLSLPKCIFLVVFCSLESMLLCTLPCPLGAERLEGGLAVELLPRPGQCRSRYGGRRSIVFHPRWGVAPTVGSA